MARLPCTPTQIDSQGTLRREMEGGPDHVTSEAERTLPRIGAIKISTEHK